MSKSLNNPNAVISGDLNRLIWHVVEDNEVLPIFVFEFKFDGRCIYVNNACCKHFKTSREFLLTQRMRHLSTRFSDGNLPDEIMHTLLAGNAYTFEDAHVISTGETIPVETTLHCFTENSIPYAVTYCVDIRERKKIEQENLAIKEAQARLEAESHFKRLVEAYPDPLVRTDTDGVITYVRADVASHFGFLPEQMLGHVLCNLPMRQELKVSATGISKAAVKAGKENKPVVYEEWVDLDGQKFCAEIRHIPERDQNGHAIGVLGFSRIITERAIQDRILRFLVQFGPSVDDFIFDKMVITLKEMLLVDCVTLFLLDENQEGLTIKSSSRHWFDDDESAVTINDLLFQNTLAEGEIYYSKHTDENFPHDSFISEKNIKSVLCTPLLAAGEHLLGFVSVFSLSEIDHLDTIKNTIGLIANSLVSKLERIQLEEIERARAEDFRVLVESSPDYISRFDKNFNCIYVNPVLGALGFAPGSAAEYAHIDFRDQVDEVLLTGNPSSQVYRGLTPNNEVYDVETRVIAEKDKDGNITGAIVIGRDISDRVVLEERLRKQAETDALTDLPNRRALTERLRFAIASAKRQGSHVGLLFVDLDRFKAINDTLGHEMGDELLREAAKRLQTVVRESDMVSRFGGDEFVVLLTSVKDPIDIVKIANSIIDILAKPYFLDTMTTYLSASVGIANFPNDTETPGELIAHADQAMYIAKQHGRNTYRFFTPSMQAEADERLLLLNDLRVALEKDQFKVVFQPIAHGASGQIKKAEALLRWSHPNRGFIPPDKFIPLAEDTGLIDSIGDWVFKQSINFAKTWKQQCGEDIQVSINVSPRQFNQDTIVARWIAWLNEIDLPSGHVTLEVTESLLLEDQDGLQEKIDAFRAAGFEFALDDFGTGYSAMSYLKKFTLDYLKIDGSFVRDMTNDKNDLAIVETIAVMAARLGMKSVAECVETEEQNNLLLSFGCDYIQGYYHSKPLDKEEFLASKIIEDTAVNTGS